MADSHIWDAPPSRPRTPSRRSTPAQGHTSGGFHLYSFTAVNRLDLIKRMKLLGFTVEEMVEVLTDLDTLEAGSAAPKERTVLTERLDGTEIEWGPR